MAGEGLMCVWQAIWSRDKQPAGGDVKTELTKVVTEALRACPLVAYDEQTFDATFTSPTVSFDAYKAYVESILGAPGAPPHLLAACIEEGCWGLVEKGYTAAGYAHIAPEDVRKLWQIFNRVSLKDSYTAKGPVADPEEISWLMEKIANTLGQSGINSSSLSTEGGVSFPEFLQTLDTSCFEGADPVLARQCVEELHGWLVTEVLKIGHLNLRAKKQANWSNWAKRWFVLTPYELIYYDSEHMKTKKGETLIEEKINVEPLKDACRFCLHNRPSLEIQLTASTEQEKQEWMSCLQTLVGSAKSGTTPLLLRRAQLKQAQNTDALAKLEAEMAERHEVAKRLAHKLFPSANDSNGDVTDHHHVSETQPGDNIIEVQKDKIKLIFSNIDIDGNGKIDKEEFHEFVSDLGLSMNQHESNVIFSTVDEDENGFIFFEEFYNYFVRVVMGESEVSETESKFRAAFLAADRDGSGMISFQEFAEYASSCRQDLAMSRLLQAFGELDKDKSGEISFREFHKFFKDEAEGPISSLGMVNNPECTPATGTKDILKDVYDLTDAEELADYLHNRWQCFAGFKRPGVTGDLVMTGSEKMVDDFVPGEYALIDLACFNDLPPMVPKHAVAQTTWVKSSVPGKSGRVIFNDDFDGRLPTVIATNENLAYYGASLADKQGLKVSLLYRHGVQDFTYENNYMSDYVMAENALGGAGIETHGFAHLDCPLDDDNGFFVLGKMAGPKEMHLTAFKVPARQTLYVPPDVIHSNDNLRGTWRTMLSDEAEINHVQLVKHKRQGNVESIEHFHFTFAPLM